MKNYLTKLIALMVLAALLVPAALAEGIVDNGEPAPAEQAPFELENNETYGEQTVVLGGELPFQGLSTPPAWNGGGGTTADANGGIFAFKPRNVTVPVNGCVKATLTYKPDYDANDITYECSDEEVVGVHFGKWYKYQLEMWIYGLKEGTAALTFTDDFGYAATLTITVTLPEAGGSTLSVSTDSVTVRAGDLVDCIASLSLFHGNILVETSDPDVAKVGIGNWRGSDFPIYIFGLKKGRATITISNNQNDDVAVIQVQVTKGTKKVYPGKGRQDGKQKCRALLIGNTDFEPITMAMAGDVGQMSRMLKTVKGPKGRAWTVTEKLDQTVESVPNVIFDAFREADEDDLSLFFISTHGDATREDEEAGALGFVLGNIVQMSELAEMLKAVPGKVVIIIDACGSGAGVYETQTEQNAAMNALRKSAEAFDHAVVEMFALADTCVADDVLRTTSTLGEAEPNPGELRVPDKFYVLTACRYLETCFSFGYEGYSFFTKCLVDGIGRKGRMKADKNRDGIATLVELYKYISKVGDDQGWDVGGDHLYYQHVQMYPKNSAFEVFKRK